MSADYAAYMTRLQEARVPGIGPSGVDGCFRQHGYAFLGVPRTDSRGTGKADLGTLMHLGWDRLIAAQYSPEERSTNVPVAFGPPLRSGTADDVDWVHGVTRDLKTTSAFSFQVWVDDDGPGQSYWDQVQVYGWGLMRDGTQINQVGIVGICRESGDVAEWLRPYDPDLAEGLVEKMRRRQEALDVAARAVRAGADAANVVEQFPQEGRGYDVLPCSFCAWRTQCLGPDDSQPMAVETHDPEVVERATTAAADYLEARREKALWTDRMETAKATLAGLRGTFGGVSVGWGEPQSRQVPDPDAMVAALEAEGIEVPLRWSTRKGAIQVRRVRG